ncbi:hypothetical protein [Brevibacillus sp. SYSU BS000544]|uniref:hypothetical protein n=1 Tax=Brevibacillus sp. SYSU BS000544 TaxID=3416443 RepID=UPI003CE5821A
MNNKAMVKWLVRIGSVTFVAAVIGGISVLDSAKKQTDPAQISLSADMSPAASQKSLLPHVKALPPQERGHRWRGDFKRNDHGVFDDDNDDYDDDDNHDDDWDQHEKDHDEDGDDWLWEIVPGHDSQTDTRTKAS